MRILFVGTLPPHPGGSARSAVQLLEGLAARGHQVRGIAPRSDSPLASEHFGFEAERFEVPAFAFDHTRPPSAADRDREAERVLEALGRAVAREKPDLVFVGRETYAAYVVPEARRLGIRTAVRTPGGVSSSMLLGIYPEDATREIVRGFRLADAVISPAQHLAAKLDRQLGVPGVQVVPNAVPVALFERRPDARSHLGLRPNARIVGHASNLVAPKRALDLLLAAEHVLAADPDAFYVIAGDGPDAQPLRDGARERGIGDRFRMLGQFDYERMPYFFSALDAFVMPVEDETAPRVVLESMAAGAVVLASDIPASRELLVDGEESLLFPVGDTQAQARATLRVLKDPPLAERLRRAARRKVESRDVSTAVDRYVELFGRLLSG